MAAPVEVPASRRNAAMRRVLTQTWPACAFSVRREHWASSVVRWVDGPTQQAVHAALRTVVDKSREPWPAQTVRDVTDELLAVAYWRARQRAGPDYYREFHPVTGAPLTPADAGVHPAFRVAREYENLDGGTITAPERLAAAAILAIAGELPPGSPAGPRGRQVARTVAVFGWVADDLLPTT